MLAFFQTLSKLEQKVLQAILSLAGCGIVAVLAGLMGWLYPIFSLVLVVPAFFTVQSLALFIQDVRPTWPKFLSKLTSTLFAFTMFSHFIGVLLPETGFDALWYHLPLIKMYVEQHQLVYNPAFYQSLYPQFGDMILALGFQIAGVLGTKLMAYWSGVLLLLVCYAWLRRHTSQMWSLLMITVIGLFQVVGWQMSSAYVDVISALWLVTGAWLLLRETEEYRFKDSQILLVTFFLACFIGTKFINLGSVPLLAGMLLWEMGKRQSRQWRISSVLKQWQLIMQVIAIFVMVAGFWFVRAYVYTGNLLYPMGDPSIESLMVQMPQDSWGEWLGYRLATIYRLPWEFVVKNDGYTTFLIPIFIIAVFYLVKVSVKIDRQWLILWLIGGYGTLFWWFFPPPSTRYVLGQLIVGFIGLAVVIGKELEKNFDLLGSSGKKGRLHNGKITIFALIFLSILVHLAIRFAVNTRGIPHLLGIETQQQYLNRFRNGFADDKIDSWYGE